MPDPLRRARHFRDRAAECEALADISPREETKRHYRHLAQTYISLARAEESLAKSEAILRPGASGELVKNPKAPAVRRRRIGAENG